MTIVIILYSIILVFCIARHIQGFSCSWNITLPMLTACCIAIYGSAEDMYYEDLCKLCASKTEQMPQMSYYLTEPSLFYGWLLFNWIVYMGITILVAYIYFCFYSNTIFNIQSII